MSFLARPYRGVLVYPPCRDAGSIIRILAIFVLCGLLVACHRSKGLGPETIQDFSALASIQSIYIADLGHEEGAGLAKEKIRMRLAQSGRFSVVETAQEADAILAGAVGITRTYSGRYSGMKGQIDGDLSTEFFGVGVLRLVETKTTRTIWTYEYRQRFPTWLRVASNRLADGVAGKLLNDAARADSAKIKSQPQELTPAHSQP